MSDIGMWRKEGVIVFVNRELRNTCERRGLDGDIK